MALRSELSPLPARIAALPVLRGYVDVDLDALDEEEDEDDVFNVDEAVTV
ncbi:MAG: hypothetical protein ACK52K_03450 [Alphaproteobacteria bacterium]|jgi:hypothetical protein